MTTYVKTFAKTDAGRAAALATYKAFAVEPLSKNADLAERCAHARQNHVAIYYARRAARAADAAARDVLIAAINDARI